MAIESKGGILHQSLIALGIACSLVLYLISGNMAFVVFSAAWILILILAHADAHRGLQKIQVEREMVATAHEGEFVTVRLRIINRSRYLRRYLEIVDSMGAALSETQKIPLGRALSVGGVLEFQYSIECSRSWGVYEFGVIELRSRDALGLFCARRIIIDPRIFTVFPEVYKVPTLDEYRGIRSLAASTLSLAYAGQSSLYMGVRDYAEGDEHRRIHWPATARRGQLSVKEYESDEQPYFTLFMDLHRRHRAGTGLRSTLDFLVRTGASMLWTAAARGEAIQVFGEDFNSIAIPAARGQTDLALALHQLVNARQNGETVLADVVSRSLSAIPRGSTVMLLYSTMTPDLVLFAQALQQLYGRETYIYCVFVDGESFAAVETWPTPIADRARHHQQLQLLLARHGACSLTLNVEADLEQELKAWEGLQ